MVERFAFTQRELSIAQHIVQGRADAEIARDFGTSIGTVKTQIKVLRKKFDASGETRVTLANKLREVIAD